MPSPLVVLEPSVPIGSPRRRLGPALVVGALVVAAACAFAAWLFLRPPSLNPVRVVVGLGGTVDPKFDERLVKNFVDGLARVGFDAAPAPAPAVSLEALRTAAREADAAQVVLLEIAVTPERPGQAARSALYRARLGVTVASTIDELQPRGDALEFAFERSSPLEIATMVQDTWLDALLPSAIDALYAGPALARILAGGGSSEIIPFAVKLREHEGAVELRRERMQSFASFCALEKEALGRTEPGVQCTGDPCGQWTVIGVDRQGQNAIAQDIGRRPIFSIPDERHIGWAEPPEQLVSIPLVPGAAPRTILRAGHFYGFGRLSEDRAFAGVASFATGRALGLVTLSLADGQWRDVALLGPDERALDVQPAPDGTGAIADLRGQGYHLFRGGERIPLASFGDAAWVELPGQGLRIVGDLPNGTLGVLRPDGAPEGEGPELPGELVAIAGVRPGALWLEWETARGCSLGVFEIAPRTLRETDALPLCVDDPTLLPDGRLVGVALATSARDTPGDPEVVVVDPTAGTVTPLTSGTALEEAVHVSPDGRRVVFNRRLGRWPAEEDLQIYRRVVCWADVP